MYLFAWLMIAAAVIALIYFVSRQSKDPGVNIFPLNFVHDLPANISREQPRTGENTEPPAH